MGPRRTPPSGPTQASGPELGFNQFGVFQRLAPFLLTYPPNCSGARSRVQRFARGEAPADGLFCMANPKKPPTAHQSRRRNWSAREGLCEISTSPPTLPSQVHLTAAAYPPTPTSLPPTPSTLLPPLLRLRASGIMLPPSRPRSDHPCCRCRLLRPQAQSPQVRVIADTPQLPGLSNGRPRPRRPTTPTRQWIPTSLPLHPSRARPRRRHPTPDLKPTQRPRSSPGTQRPILRTQRPKKSSPPLRGDLDLHPHTSPGAEVSWGVSGALGVCCRHQLGQGAPGPQAPVGRGGRGEGKERGEEERRGEGRGGGRGGRRSWTTTPGVALPRPNAQRPTPTQRPKLEAFRNAATTRPQGRAARGGPPTDFGGRRTTPRCYGAPSAHRPNAYPTPNAQRPCNVHPTPGAQRPKTDPLRS